MATSSGERPRKRNIDLKTRVQQYENLNAPQVEYEFSTRKKFYRHKGKSAIYR